MVFLKRDNFIKGKAKPIKKLNSSLTQYLRMKLKKKTNLKKVKLVKPANHVN